MSEDWAALLPFARCLLLRPRVAHHLPWWAPAYQRGHRLRRALGHSALDLQGVCARGCGAIK
eukprot:2861516-Alexandrium_andersonii.AAC.1